MTAGTPPRRAEATTAAPSPPVEHLDIDRTQVGVDASRLARISPRDMAVRFAFGATVSVASGITSLALGLRAGGVLLAFPAVLPAALTLVEKREGTSEAVSDVRGAVVGAVGMVFFAVTVVALAGRIPAALALLTAVAVWVVTSTALYFGGRRMAAAMGEQHYLPDVGVIEAEPVVETLRRGGLTAAVGESVSGGVVAALLLAVPGSAGVVRGGVVAPTAATMSSLLDVPAELLEREGLITEAVARAMAEGVRRRLGADVGVGVTGPADGAQGLTYVAATGPARIRVACIHGDRGPEANRGDTVRTALRLARSVAEPRRGAAGT
ncbi:MAG TPA: DUF3147 family protein [Candidatus Dormibacteraeota bacterium]|jgi:PncC family amidohydrolase|nr:DUF3147 family protein [Candidatus Dormibacteraeota bacterium]